MREILLFGLGAVGTEQEPQIRFLVDPSYGL